MVVAGVLLVDVVVVVAGVLLADVVIGGMGISFLETRLFTTAWMHHKMSFPTFTISSV